jgi:hypothetical protein
MKPYVQKKKKLIKLSKNPLFNVPNSDTYPPFKNGLYIEEFFCQQNTSMCKRL